MASTKAVGIYRQIAYRKESTWGVLPGASGAKQIRRVTADFNLIKDAYESNEIRTDQQTADYRHGVRSAEGSISAELSPGSYADFIASVLARDWTASGTATGLTLAVAAAGTNFTLTRSTGSFITDGFRVGQVVRITAGTGADPANLNNNLLIISLTATIATVQVLSRVSLVVQASITAAAMSAVGKSTYVPLTGHTNDSYTFENWYSDISQSEVFTGLRPSNFSVSLPATGLVTSDFGFIGKNLEQSGAVRYFTTPTAAGTTGIFAAVQGAMIVNGSAAACITSADFSVDRNMEAAQCVGSNFASEIFAGRITASGNLSAYFSDGTLRDYFANETPVTLVMALTTSTEKNADVMTFVFPKVKLNSATNADGTSGIVQSIAFTALLNDNVTGNGLEQTTVQIQDTTLV